MFINAGLMAQESEYGPGYQFAVMANPAFSGSEGTGTLRFSYLNFYPGNHFGLNSFYTSFDRYVNELHGGAGVWLANDYIGGIVNDFRGGLSYAYSLQAGKELYINAGLSASLFHRGFSMRNAVFPDQIDPLGGVTMPSADLLDAGGKTAFDIGTGFLFIYRNFFGGFSVSHLSQPYFTMRAGHDDRLMRKLAVQGAYNVALGPVMLRPVGFLELQGGELSASAGAVFEIERMSVNAIIGNDNSENIDMQAGLSFSTGIFSFFYNYRFNLRSDNVMMPFSLLHETGLAFGLNNVDKRKKAGTIRFPKM